MHQALLPTKAFFPNVKTQLYRLKSMLCYKNTLLYFSHKNICFFDIRIISFLSQQVFCFLRKKIAYLMRKNRAFYAKKIANLIAQTKCKAKLSSMEEFCRTSVYVVNLCDFDLKCPLTELDELWFFFQKIILTYCFCIVQMQICACSLNQLL